jgi:AcrR family transcriptional regulator
MLDFMVVGLRERKKSATKDALSAAALELALERGLHGATAEAIAGAADVSTRTFHNYFANKEDAILFVLEKIVAGLVDAFAERDPREPILDSLEAVMVDSVESDGVFDRMIAVNRLMAQHPSLVARHVAVHDTTSDPLLSEIARRTGTDPAVDLYPRLVYQATNAVCRSAMELHIDRPLDAAALQNSLVAAFREGFRQLRRGLPQSAWACC